MNKENKNQETELKKSCYLLKYGQECSHKFSSNKCYFCEKPIYSYIEVRGFYIDRGYGIDEVIPICYLCWLNNYYSWEIYDQWGAGKSYYGKKDLEGDWWEEEEIQHLSEYYHQQRPEEVKANQFIDHWFTLEFSNELRTTIELLEKEREWSECYNWIHQLRFEINYSDDDIRTKANIFKYNQLKKNPQLKELYQKLEKVDIEQLWKKEIQQETIPVWKEIIKIQAAARTNSLCSSCYSNPLTVKIPQRPELNHDNPRYEEKDLDYLCKECIEEEIQWRESKDIKDSYFEGINGNRYKAIKICQKEK